MCALGVLPLHTARLPTEGSLPLTVLKCQVHRLSQELGGLLGVPIPTSSLTTQSLEKGPWSCQNPIGVGETGWEKEVTERSRKVAYRSLLQATAGKGK